MTNALAQRRRDSSEPNNVATRVLLGWGTRIAWIWRMGLLIDSPCPPLMVMFEEGPSMVEYHGSVEEMLPPHEVPFLPFGVLYLMLTGWSWGPQAPQSRGSSAQES